MKKVPQIKVVGDTANVRVFKQITTNLGMQPIVPGCWRYCKCTSFQANHNTILNSCARDLVVGDTANVRVFKQITTSFLILFIMKVLLAILQMYEFSSKSQR